MPVQVPKLNRFEPQQTPSVGRSELQLPNVPAIVQPQMNALMDLGEQQVKYFQKQEDNAIDTAAKAAANEYNIYLNNELNKARVFKGDPTAIYSQFDESSNTKYEEILNKNPNLSSRGKQFVAQALQETKDGYQMKRDTAWYGQYYDYDKNVTEVSAKLKANNLMSVAGYIDPTKPETFRPMDALIRGITIDYQNHGEKFGAVTRDEAGNQMSTDEIKLKIGETVSSGLVATINNLNDSGRPDLADAVYTKYFDYIDVTKKDDVLKSIREEERTLKALNIVPKVQGKSDEQVTALLSKEFKDDPKGRQKAEEAIDAESRRRKNRRDRISDQSYNSAFNIVSARMQSDEPFSNVFEMEQAIKKQLKTITKPAQKKALQEMVDKPGKSDMDVYQKNLGFVGSMGYVNMNESQLMENLQGLNEKHRNFFVGQWTKQRTETESAVRARVNSSWEILKDKLINTKVLPTADGKLTQRGKDELARIQTKFYLSSNNFNKETSAVEMEKLRLQVYDEELKNKDAKKPEWQKKIGEWWDNFRGNKKTDEDRAPYDLAPNSPLNPNTSRQVPKSTPAPITDKKTGAVTPSTGAPLTKAEMQAGQAAFVKEKGRPIKDLNELKAYINAKKGVK
jgi:hypothetical protein